MAKKKGMEFQEVTLSIGVTFPGSKQFTSTRLDLSARVTVKDTLEAAVKELQEKLWKEFEGVSGVINEATDKLQNEVEQTRKKRDRG